MTLSKQAVAILIVSFIVLGVFRLQVMQQIYR